MILKRLLAVLAGRSLWLEIKRKYDVDNGVYVLLMTEDDTELNEQALRHIDDLVSHRGARGVVILTNNEHVNANALSYSTNVKDVLMCSTEQINKLLAYVEFYMFTERLMVISLTKPYGNKLYKAVGVNGLTKEDLVCLSLFIIRSWQRQESSDG